VSETPVLSLRDVSIAFDGREPVVKGVSCDVWAGATTCIVGESGSGKTLTSLAVMGLLPGTGKLVAGEVRGPEGALWAAPGEHRAPVGRDVAMVFQDPMSSLNPSMRVGAQVAEPLELHQGASGEAAQAEVARLFAEVGLPEGSERKYPHELSGGQKQRVMIALALACNPKVLLADEPTTALDVTVQRDVLDLLQELRDARGLGVLFVTHDLDVVKDIADHVVVMRHGAVVESGTCKDVMEVPKHAYTQELLAAMPSPATNNSGADETEGRPLIEVRGVVKRYVTKKNVWGKPVAHFEALKGERREHGHRGRRARGLGRRKRVGKIDAWPRDARARDRRRGRGELEGRCGERSRVSEVGAARVSGSLLGPESPNDGWRSLARGRRATLGGRRSVGEGVAGRSGAFGRGCGPEARKFQRGATAADCPRTGLGAVAGILGAGRERGGLGLADSGRDFGLAQRAL